MPPLGNRESEKRRQQLAGGRPLGGEALRDKGKTPLSTPRGIVRENANSSKAKARGLRADRK